MKEIIVALLLGLCCFSCEDNLDIMLPYEGKKFVLYAELSPNKVVEVKIDRTYPPTGHFEFDDGFLDEVKVELYEDGVFIENLERVVIRDVFDYPTNRFKSPSGFKPMEGKAYYISTSADGFKRASSQPIIIPEKMEIINVEFSDEEIISTLNAHIPARLLELTLNDLSNLNGYFAIEIDGYYNEIRTSSAIIAATENDSDFEDPCLYSLSSRLKFYNSKCFNKSENTLSFITELIGGVQNDPSKGGGGNQDITSLRIKVSTVSSFYLDFFKDNINPEGIFKAFEPIKKTLTNVNNGYGAVLGKNENIIYLEVE